MPALPIPGVTMVSASNASVPLHFRELTRPRTLSGVLLFPWHLSTNPTKASFKWYVPELRNRTLTGKRRSWFPSQKGRSKKVYTRRGFIAKSEWLKWSWAFLWPAMTMTKNDSQLDRILESPRRQAFGRIHEGSSRLGWCGGLTLKGRQHHPQDWVWTTWKGGSQLSVSIQPSL